MYQTKTEPCLMAFINNTTLSSSFRLRIYLISTSSNEEAGVSSLLLTFFKLPLHRDEYHIQPLTEGALGSTDYRITAPSLLSDNTDPAVENTPQIHTGLIALHQCYRQTILMQRCLTNQLKCNKTTETLTDIRSILESYGDSRTTSLRKSETYVCLTIIATD